MTPRYKTLVLVGDGLVAIGGLVLALVLAPVWLPVMLWRVRQQRLELDMPDPIEKQRTAHLIAMEGHDGPRNSSDDQSPENYQA